MRTNRSVKLFRLSAPVGLGANVTLELVDSRIPVWLRLNRSVTITADGMEALSDGSIRFESHWDVRQGDVITLQGDGTKKYRLESLSEVHNPTGTLIAFDCSLIRDSSFE